ncbi:hypothetical protein EK904_008867, partial [Melospiza melodia maxima]
MSVLVQRKQGIGGQRSAAAIWEEAINKNYLHFPTFVLQTLSFICSQHPGRAASSGTTTGRCFALNFTAALTEPRAFNPSLVKPSPARRLWVSPSTPKNAVGPGLLQHFQRSKAPGKGFTHSGCFSA